MPPSIACIAVPGPPIPAEDMLRRERYRHRCQPSFAEFWLVRMSTFSDGLFEAVVTLLTRPIVESLHIADSRGLLVAFLC